MATKLQFYSFLAEKTAKEVTAGRGNWQDFLDTASRLYKYPFPDQLMIYAQRPDTIACAPLETWNDSFNRWVRRGAKGIALIDDNGDRPRLRYVFDVADTEPSQQSSRPVQLWEMQQEHRAPVLEHLSSIYDDVGDTLADSLHNIAKQLAREYYEDNAREIRYRAQDSFLEDYDDFNLSVAFGNALANSVAYSLMSRCGFDTSEYFDDDDFQYIYEFNSPDMVCALGTAAGELSQQVLRDIELVIKKYERQRAAERRVENERNPDIHPERGLPAARPDTGRASEGIGGTVRQVREDAESVPEGTPDNIIQFDAIERDAVPAPPGDGGTGKREVGTGDENPDLSVQPARQDSRPDGMDSGDERPESAGAGDGAGRTRLRIDEQEPEQQHERETEQGADGQAAPFSTPENGGADAAANSQIENTTISEALSSSSVSLDEFDSILRNGGNDKNSILRITAYYSKGLPHDDNTDFLRREYLMGRWGKDFTPGGKGFQFGAQETSIWFDDNGIIIGRGKSALSADDYALITWDQAASRVRQLYDAGMYVSHDTLDEAIDNEHRELARRLLDMYRDDFRDFRETPAEWTEAEGGWPSYVKTITELLKDKGDNSEYSIILRNLEEDVTALETEPNAPERLYTSPHRLLQDVRNAGLPTQGFPSARYAQLNYTRFITEDEVDHYLTKGSNYNEGKLRIMAYLLQSHTQKERVDFLKYQYGHGGGSWVGGGWYEAEPGKGITLKRPDCGDVTLNWNSTAQRIDALIQSGRYMTRPELAGIFNYERLVLARQIKIFYYNMPDEYERPFPADLKLNYPKQAEWEAVNGLLDNVDRVEALLGQMQRIYENTPEEDRHYAHRKVAYNNLVAFRDSRFNLFPGLENLPEPDHVESHWNRTATESAVAFTLPQPAQTSESQQLSMFDVDAPPLLPSVEEQQTKIERISNQANAATTPTVSLPITQDEIDALLLSVSDADKDRLTAQFNNQPRSREAVQMVREVYRSIEETISRLDGEDGYLGILGEPTGVAIVRGALASVPLPERQPSETLTLTWPAIHKRIAELVDAGRLAASIRTGQSAPTRGIPAKPIELDFDAVAQTIYERVMQDVDYTETLLKAASRASLRNPCTWALEQSIRDHEQDEPEVYHAYFTDDEFNDRLFGFILRQSWKNRPTPEVAVPEPVQEKTAGQPVSESQDSPPPVFFVNWESAQYDFDLNLYKDRDVIGYDKDGVMYGVGRSGSLTYITSTGFLWGDNSVPGHIFEQITAYTNGSLTDEQVRENYLEILKMFTAVDNAQPQIPAPPQPASQNFRITDDHLGEGGAKTKYRYNLDAINTLKAVEQEQRGVTLDEQQTLSRYVGWGGLPQAFESENKQWEKEYHELKAALSPEEYESARASTLNAHYTAPTVIKAIYGTVERLGFKTGNILEPSCGVGNFFGLLPESMKGSKLYGVELDSITARIAKQLYPKADIRETGFERADMPDAFFDLAIGNVPFGNYGVTDKRYDKHNFSIHNYFFAKALDQVRPGGIIAFITSKYTMDEKSPKVRKYLAERAELLGAVRLPNNAFLKNAGTETTMDIIFLQKRDRPIDIEPDWVHLGQLPVDNGQPAIPVNSYFIENPEMLLGRMAPDEKMNSKYGTKGATACLPIEGADLTQQLETALHNIRGQYIIEELDDLDGVDNHAIPADPNVRNFSYALVAPASGHDNTGGQAYTAKISGGAVYFRENSLMYPVDLPAATLERIKGMIALRDCVHELIALQLDEHGDDEIKTKQAELSGLYDNFSANYGLINSQANSRAFSADSAYYLLCSLEIVDEDGELERKADMFSRRTIKQRTIIEHVDTASEALAVSLGEKACVDMEYMSKLTGRDEAALFSELRGVIFLDCNFNGNPDSYTYRTADDYLSGNVREKLKKYTEALETVPEGSKHYEAFIDNIEALTAAMPKDLDASEIAVRLGSTWIDPQYVQQFMHSMLKTSWRMKNVYEVKYHPFTGEWQVTGKGRAQYSDVLANVTYGTSRMNAYQIIDDTLNLRDVRVYDYKEDADGKEKRVLNKKETMLAQQKQEQIKQAFKDWIWQDPNRRQELVKLYNERFNSVRPREYDGSHITFSGISPEITLRPHQLNAIAHGLYGGNLLLAHVVGAGKTFEMVAIAMESKRLGLCHKSLFAVPNHLTEQWAGEFLRLYPSANILVATKKEFEMRNRKKFCAKIATGDYDAVIIGHSQLEKIPMSKERQQRLFNEQINEIEQGIADLKESNGERWSIKQLEKTKKSLETRLRKLLDAKQHDDVVTFEQLGADRLFIDEAHGFKNLFMFTKMRNVAGLSTSEAQKSSDLFMKCRYMDELTGGKGVIFATGTPISNSITEMYTMQRYLQYDTLVAKGLTHFDCWSSTFGETQTSIELSPEGTGYRARTRFAKFHNCPELMCMFKEVADIQTADMLNLPVPEARYENVIVEPSELQKEMVQELSERAALVNAQLVDAKIDNMLKITTDGRKIGLDQRLMNPLLPDYEGSKVNACTENVYRIWDETKDGKLTQLVFCDFSTPNKEGRFNIYDDIRAKLIGRGIPENEIAFIHDADTETKKKELFAKVRQGKVRILFGSTFKMGAGTNVQDRLIAIHDADCPWRPSDLEQRSGRIVRQGNKNNEVMIYRYATSGTFDSYIWQAVEAKQRFISQIMTSKSPARSCDDVDETALSYAEIKALCTGNPLIAEKMNLDVEVARLRMLKSEHQSQHYHIEDSLLKHYPQQIIAVKGRIAGIEKDIVVYSEQADKLAAVQHTSKGAATATLKFAGMTINGVFHAEKEPAAKALVEACKELADKKELAIGSYMGFDMSLRLETTLRIDGLQKAINVLLRGSMTYQAELGTDTFGNITRINNALSDLPKKLEGAKSQLETLYQQQDAAKQELAKPFALAGQLAEKEARLALVNSELNIDGDGGFDVLNDTDSRDVGMEQDGHNTNIDKPDDIYAPRTASAKSTRPSMLDELRSRKPDTQPPVSSKKQQGLGI